VGFSSSVRAAGLPVAVTGLRRSSQAVARDFLRLVQGAEAIAHGARWVLVALACGSVPLLAAWATGFDFHRPATALLLMPVWLCLVRRDREGAACGMVFLTFAVHSVLAMTLVRLDTAGADHVLLDGPAYWVKNIHWIRTGLDPEYELLYWVPAHVQDAAGMAVYGVSSLGFVPLVRGLYQIDLMNCYVGHLLAVSRSGAVALFVGWHVWSILRGVAYTRLCFAATSQGLEWMTGLTLSTPARRWRRWLVAAVLLVADAILKWLLLEPVRQALHSNLVP
jgi:hypothetical protein